MPHEGKPSCRPGAQTAPRSRWPDAARFVPDSAGSQGLSGWLVSWEADREETERNDFPPDPGGRRSRGLPTSGAVAVGSATTQRDCDAIILCALPFLLFTHVNSQALTRGGEVLKRLPPEFSPLQDQVLGSTRALRATGLTSRRRRGRGTGADLSLLSGAERGAGVSCRRACGGAAR